MKIYTEQIRLQRLQRNLSQENMADLLGISTTAFGDIERGKTDLTISRLYQIADIFEMDVIALLDESLSFRQELLRLELEKTQIENDKLRLENQYLKEKLAGKMVIDLIREKIEPPKERPKIGF